MEAHLQALITWFSVRPQVALAAVFAASLLEAVAIVGTVIPGSTIVFAGGVLIGLNALDAGWTAAAAVTVEHLEHPARMITLSRTVKGVYTPTQVLEDAVREQHQSTEKRQRDGEPVLLVWQALALNGITP